LEAAVKLREVFNGLFGPPSLPLWITDREAFDKFKRSYEDAERSRWTDIVRTSLMRRSRHLANYGLTFPEDAEPRCMMAIEDAVPTDQTRLDALVAEIGAIEDGIRTRSIEEPIFANPAS
jgi:hypothetical protein